VAAKALVEAVAKPKAKSSFFILVPYVMLIKNNCSQGQ
jgi:hypothetical protein